ncbi:MAG TPA: hypothetical protein VHM72_07060 [Solirubrobacteraceae bacterium]|nr:hypothetical protein [Solirubrobacteraceae bacterium]
MLFPLVLAAIGLGWGALVQWIAGERELGALTIPIGLASAIVVAGILTAFAGTASIAAPVTAIGALAGVGYVWGRARLGAAPALAAIGVLLVYGAPVILSGEATFLGYVRLDDTATWFNLIDQLFSHGRSFVNLPSSTYLLNAQVDLGTTGAGSAYPAGAFMLTGIGHWVTGIDVAWIFQPYLACCAAALSLAIYALVTPLLEWRWLRAFVAFIAAQSALLFGYAAWGGIKELTAAFLVALGVALAAQLLTRDDPRPRNVLPLAVAAGALMITLGVGAAIYAVPVFLALVAGFAWRVLRGGHLLNALLVGAALILASALFGLPLWLLVGHYLQVDQGSYSAGSDALTQLGNLLAPLRAIQIAGIWPAGDFRDVIGVSGPFLAPAALPRYAFTYLVFVAGGGGVVWGLWRRSPALAIYVAIALFGVLWPWSEGITPWLIAKALTISSPAILLAGLVGGAMLFSQERLWALVAGAIVLVAIGAGVLWSNWLQYRDVSLAPRDQLAELQTIADKVSGRGPTFINEYQIYADRHFLRAGAPVEPAEYRSVLLPTVTGAWLTKSAFADIDSFPLSTLEPYRSLVIRRSPVESRPPSIYQLVWQGRFYQLWQQRSQPARRVIKHVPLGDTQLDYCGAAEQGRPTEPLCAIKPAAVAPCPEVLSLARLASQDDGELLAYERPNPIVLRGTQTVWPAGWMQDDDPEPEDALTATTPGTAVAHVTLRHAARRYQLWLGGSFARGFLVRVDGRLVGSIANELNNLGDYNEVGSPFVLAAGKHTITVTYPPANLSPGAADSEHYTALSEIALAPLSPAPDLVEVSPAKATELCDRTLDWIEVVAPEG